jgi:tetratricopeptide (TPR) repeat protein
MPRTWLIPLLLSLAVAHAAPPKWTYGASDHFEVYTTGNAGKARDALNYFERIHAFYADVLKINPPVKAPTRIILFSNEKEFAPYRPNEGAFAFYQPGPDRDYIVMQSLIDAAYPVVVHEYMHLIMRHVIDTPLPPWMNEGWAEYYSTIQPRGDKMAVGGIPAGRMFQLTQQKLMPLSQLLRVGQNSPEYNDKKLMGSFYAQSWGLMHMLVASTDYRPASPKFIDLMLKGADSAAAIEKAYGVTLDKVQRDLEAYIRIGQFVLVLYDFQAPKARKDLETRQASPFEATLVTANLQGISRDGEAEARAAFTDLEKQNPNHLELQESFATFEYRRGHSEAALPHFAKAEELESKSWQLYRDYGYATGNAEKQSILLGKALQLNPNDMDLRLAAAGSLLRARKATQAVAALSAVKNIDQEHAYRFFQLAASANATQQSWDDARKMAEQALKYAVQDSEKAAAQSMLTSINRQIEYAEAVKKRDEAAAAAAARNTKGGAANRKQAARKGAAPEPELIAPPPPPGTVQAAEPGKDGDQILNFAEIMVDAKFQQLDCAAPTPVLVIRTDTGTLRLSMKRPESVLLKGAAASKIDLHCGSQKNATVRIGFNRDQDTKLRTTGDVRYLELK